MTEEWVAIIHRGRRAKGERASTDVFLSQQAAVSAKEALEARLTDQEKNEGWHFEVKRLSPGAPSLVKSTSRKDAGQGFGRKGPGARGRGAPRGRFS